MAIGRNVLWDFVHTVFSDSTGRLLICRPTSSCNSLKAVSMWCWSEGLRRPPGNAISPDQGSPARSALLIIRIWGAGEMLQRRATDEWLASLCIGDRYLVPMSRNILGPVSVTLGAWLSVIYSCQPKTPEMKAMPAANTPMLIDKAII